MTIVIELLRTLLSWPVVIFTLVVYFLRVFKQPLAGLLSSKSVKMQAYGVSIELAGEQNLALRKEQQITRPDENNLERYVRENPSAAIHEFIQTYNAYFFAKILNNIFGSQIRLLEHLLAKGDAGESYVSLHSFYQEHWASTGLQYANYLGFLKLANFIRYQGDPMQVFITPYGADFVSYIKSVYTSSFLELKPF